MILLVSVLAAFATWQVTGGPEQKVQCKSSELKSGYICFSDAKELPGVVWVDARERNLWEKNGFSGSIFLTDHPSEDFPTLMAEAFESLAMAEFVVVYCATEGCGSSEPIAEKIKELGLLPEENVYVLSGGWKALNN